MPSVTLSTVSPVLEAQIPAFSVGSCHHCVHAGQEKQGQSPPSSPNSSPLSQVLGGGGPCDTLEWGGGGRECRSHTLHKGRSCVSKRQSCPPASAALGLQPALWSQFPPVCPCPLCNGRGPLPHADLLGQQPWPYQNVQIELCSADQSWISLCCVQIPPGPQVPCKSP